MYILKSIQKYKLYRYDIFIFYQGITLMTKYTDKTPSELLMLDNILQYAPDWIYWKDINSIHLGCSEQFAIAAGFKNRAEMVGKSDYECAWGNRAEKYNLDDAEIIRSGKAKLNIEDTVLLGAGKEVTVISNKVPLRNSRGEVIGVLGIATDITKRKNMEKELLQAKIAAEAANQAKSEFIANMSHDIRTPLTGILGLIQELIDSADDTETSLQQSSSTDQSSVTQGKHQSLIKQQEELIEKVQENGQLLIGSADELLQLLNEILETMRLESGKTAEHAESFNFYELLKHNIELMQPVAQHKKLTLSCEIDKSIPVYFSGLRHYLDRTLLNLLSNALKFTKHGFVKIRAQLLNPETNSSYFLGDTIKLKIIVEDSGVGIPGDKFETIFDHFSRLTPSYQGIYKGAGLGLYTVKRYVEAMQATIEVESEVGKGTCFIMVLPFQLSDHSDREKVSFRIPRIRGLQAKKSVAIHKTKKTVGTNNSQIKILIVEDNPLAARAVQSSINRLGYGSDNAENGAQAVQRAGSKDYDLILMDIGLPDIDGIEATKQIRALNHPKALQVPIIALTGHADDPQKRKESLAAGMQEVLCKPLQQQKLEELLEHYVFKKGDEIVQARSIALTESQTLQKVIDWQGCIEKSGGDESLARELLSSLSIELKISQEKIDKAFAEHDGVELRKELHRVRGGVVYLSLPRLDKALAEFHEALKMKPQNQELLKNTYAELQREFKAFWTFLELEEKTSL